MIFISPTERDEAVKGLGQVSSIPERHGADILVIAPPIFLGVQRKAVPDFFASVVDGRLAKEVAQLTTSPLLTHSTLIIEGRLDWTTDGNSTLRNVNVTRGGYFSLVTSIQLEGIIVLHTEDARDTAEVCSRLAAHLGKQSHRALHTRPRTKTQWGRSTSRSFGSHLLQSFEGVGPELADRLYDHFGTVPLRWSCTYDDLLAVPGVGPKRAAALIAALGGGEDV